MNNKIDQLKANGNNDIKTIDEASVQNEFSPDYVKVKKENNFEL